MLKKLRRKTRRIVAAGLLVIIVAVVVSAIHDILPRPVNPLVAELAPGAAPAIVRALGPDGLYRVSQVVSENNKSTWYSGGTHRASGRIDGHLYGLAFDIVIDPSVNADADVRALRLQGIAAWRRGPGAPGGPAGMGPHIHCVWPGYPTSNQQNVQQIASFVHYYRGLADRDKPRAQWRDRSIRADEVARVRRVFDRIHGRGALAWCATYDSLHRGAASS